MDRGLSAVPGAGLIISWTRRAIAEGLSVFPFIMNMP